MKYTIILLLFSLINMSYASIVINNDTTPWTGDKTDGMYSNMVIKNIHTGVVDNKPYFCIEASKDSDGTSFKGCSVNGFSKWFSAFDLFYNQAMYYYSTGQQIRIYFEPNVWTHPGLSAYTKYALVGFSTCSSLEYCAGPERKK